MKPWQSTKWDSPIELIESFAFQSMEASHLKELPEGFDSSISAEQYFIWCKHHQKAAELRLNESSEMKRKLVDMESKHREEIEKLKAELGERGKRIIELGGCILEVHAQGLEALYDKKRNNLIKSITTNKGKEMRDDHITRGHAVY